MKIVLWKIGHVECIKDPFFGVKKFVTSQSETLSNFALRLQGALPVADELHLVTGPDVHMEVIDLSDSEDYQDEDYVNKVVIHDGTNMHVITLQEEVENENVFDCTNSACPCNG